MGVPPIFWLVAAGCFGAVLGSFLNVCVYRMPRGRSIVFPSSRCPNCDHAISPWDNVPILSYAALLGRCRTCGGTISIQYPLVEALTAFLFVVTVQVFALALPAPGWVDLARLGVLLAFEASMIVVTFVDFEFQIIPDEISIGGMFAGPVVAALLPSIFGTDLPAGTLPEPIRAALFSLSGLAAGAGSLWLIRKLGTWLFQKEAMGFGDVKLLGMMGSFLGPVSVFFIIALGSLLGAAVGIAMWFKKRTRVIPFGPYLAAGGLLYLFFAPHLKFFVMNTYPELLEKFLRWMGLAI